jgi:4-coumarate--CoA ligase
MYISSPDDRGNELICLDPVDIPLWTLLFDSRYSVVSGRPESEVRGFRDGASGQFISYYTLKGLSRAGSVGLQKQHQLRPGDAVCIFGLNSIWYPVALFSALHAGPKFHGSEISYITTLIAD